MTKTEEIMALHDAAATEFVHGHYHPMLEKRAALKAAIKELVAANEALTHDNHNLNWALGTDGYTEMYAAEEREESKSAVASVQAFAAKMAESKARYQQMVNDAARFYWLTEDLDTEHGRIQRNEILDRIPTMSYNAACADIDHAMEKTP